MMRRTQKHSLPSFGATHLDSLEELSESVLEDTPEVWLRPTAHGPLPNPQPGHLFFHFRRTALLGPPAEADGMVTGMSLPCSLILRAISILAISLYSVRLLSIPSLPRGFIVKGSHGFSPCE